MGFHDYISEHEAALVAGVSATTLKRFAETGYLQIENDSDGLPMYSKSDLAKVFAVDISADSSDQNSLQSEAPFGRGGTSVGQAQAGQSSSVQSESTQIKTSRFTESIPFTTVAIVGDGPSGMNADSPKYASVHACPTDIQSEHVTETNQNQLMEEVATRTAPTPLINEQRSAAPHDNRPQNLIQAHDKEIVRFRHLADMQERLLDLREQELGELRKERDWLRSRVERMEEKQDRDQLLLLAETQTIRRLVQIEETRKSPIQAALEWFGFANSRSDKNDTTVVQINPAQHASSSSESQQSRDRK